MSDTMLLGVLRMPPKLWDNGAIDVAQRHSYYTMAADRIEKDAAKIMELREDKQKLKDIIRELIDAIEWSDECYETYSWLAESFIFREIDRSSAMEEIDQSNDSAEIDYHHALALARLAAEKD